MRFIDKDLLKRPEGKAVLIAGIILGFYVVAIIKNIYIDKRETKTTAEYIKELFIQNFGIYRESLDVYINYGGLYSGKVQYTVGVGYNLDKAIFKNTVHKVIINLPNPEIFYVFQNSKIQLSKFNRRLEYIDEIYKYGELVAKYYSIRTNIFKRTKEFTENILENLSKTVRIKIALNFPDKEGHYWSVYNSKRCNISLSIPSDYKNKFLIRNNDNTLSPYCFVGATPDKKLKMFVYNSPLNLRIYPKNTDLKQFSLFYPQNEYYMEIVKDKEDKRFIRYYYKFKDKVLIVEFKPSDETAYRHYLPEIMLFSSLIKQKRFNDNAVRDCFGITKDIWDKGLAGDKQRYIEKYFEFLKSDGVIFDKKNHVLATKYAYKELVPMVKKLSKVVDKYEIRGHLVMAVLNKAVDGRTILWVFLDNGKVIAFDSKGKRKDFSYQTLIDASLETVDLGYLCIDSKFCIGDYRPEELVSKREKDRYLAERELAKLVWSLINYGFPILYEKKESL